MYMIKAVLNLIETQIKLFLDERYSIKQAEKERLLREYNASVKKLARNNNGGK